MRIKKLFKSESEYLDYAWSFLNFDEKKIWREEDLPKLKPYFDLKRGKSKLSESERVACIAHYDKCRKEYADELFEIRDSIAQFDISQLAEFFLLEPIETDCWDYDEDGNEVDEDGNIMPPPSRETIKIAEDWKEEMTFPLYFVGWIDSSSDRLGNVRMSFSEFVTLKDFEK